MEPVWQHESGKNDFKNNTWSCVKGNSRTDEWVWKAILLYHLVYCLFLYPRAVCRPRLLLGPNNNNAPTQSQKSKVLLFSYSRTLTSLIGSLCNSKIRKRLGKDCIPGRAPSEKSQNLIIFVARKYLDEPQNVREIFLGWWDNSGTFWKASIVVTSNVKRTTF